MNKLITLELSQLKQLINKRASESKFGEHVQLLTDSRNIYEQLLNLDVDYVLFGIPEDVGVFANRGKQGTASAWDAALKVLLNCQTNKFTHPERLLILGYLDFSEESKTISQLNPKRASDIKIARDIVSEMDKHVTQLVHDIVKAGKKPIIIGGGQNNAYGNIKGSALALSKKISVVNLDAHTDFRAEEGRHSGNGFSYAYSEGFLKKYFIFGLHENFFTQKVIERIEKISKDINYNTYEALFVRKTLSYKKERQRAIEFVSKRQFGIEIDCDAIENIPCSAMTPSGFSSTQAREFLHTFASHPNAIYLHICEAAPSLGSKKTADQSSKLISYLIMDFMKAHGK